MSRRSFIFNSGAAACAMGLCPRLLFAGKEDIPLREAMHWESIEGGAVGCRLCPRSCVISEGLRGHCEVRRNVKGKLYTLVFGRPCTTHIDPIEKKPLFHFLPGTQAYSLATAGCNFECKFCQNWEISQARPEEVSSTDMPPEKVVAAARAGNIPSIAFTYSEPVVFHEYVYETARLGKQQRVKTVMITNGFIRREPMKQLCGQLAAVKVDLKAFTEKFYRDTCDGALAPVLETLRLLKSEGIWYEIVVLLIPTLNDGEGEVRELSAWVRSELGPEVPLHFTRFHPWYKLKNIPPTPVATIEKARRIALKEGLRFVYVGNIPGHPGESTFCPRCNKVLISRVSYHVDSSGLKGGKCVYCGNPIPGVWA